MALRCVQNADIELTDCFVPDADRLPGARCSGLAGRLGGWLAPRARAGRARLAGRGEQRRRAPSVHQPGACTRQSCRRPGRAPRLLRPLARPLLAAAGVSSFADTNKVLAISRVMVAWQPVSRRLPAPPARRSSSALRDRWGLAAACSGRGAGCRERGRARAGLHVRAPSPLARPGHAAPRHAHSPIHPPQVGLALGAYDMCARYLAQRRQFGAPLASFQLVQEKLQRMLATCQAM